MPNMFTDEVELAEAQYRLPVPASGRHVQSAEGPTSPPPPQGGGEREPSRREEPPTQAVDTRSWGERRSLGARPGGQTHGGQRFGGWTPDKGYPAPTQAAEAPSGGDEGGSKYGGNKFGGNEFGGNKFGGNKFGGQRFGGSRTGIPEREPAPEPDNPNHLGPREYGGNKFGGNEFGGNKFGGQKFGGSRTGIPDSSPTLPPTYTDEQIRQNPWLQTPGGARFGGQTHGGNTFGGNRFGGNTFGGYETGRTKDTADAAGKVIAGAGTPRGVGTAAAEGLRPPEPFQHHPDDTHPPSGEQPEPFQHHPDDTHPPSGGQPPGPFVPGDSDAGYRPGPLPKGAPRPGAPRPGGGGAGTPTGNRGRKPLGDQTRQEAYDPILDRKDPRNVGLVDDQGRVNPKLYEDAQKKGAIDPTAPGVRTGEVAQAYTNNYTSALANATKYMAETFHQKPGDPNQAEGYNALTFKGLGAPDPNLVNGIFGVVDPRNELQPKERMELATRAMHDWYEANGNPKAAAKVAGEMLQYGNKQAQTFGKQAMQALKTGDKIAAVRAIGQAYDWLPDGFTSDVKGNSLVVANDKGQVVQTIPLDDKMIANLSTGLATGTLYWDLVQQRAGVQSKFGPPPPQPTQAVATTVPGAPGAPGAAPVGGAPARATAAAPPAAAATAPAGPPSGPAQPPPAPPGGVPPARPVSAPAGSPSPPPPITPPSNRPAAPAPAAPGPSATPQAAPTPPAPAPAPSPPAASAAPATAMQTTVPPPLAGPVQPSTTKRPIVEGQASAPPPAPQREGSTGAIQTGAAAGGTPAQGSGGPSGSPAGAPAATGGSQAANEPKWNPDDPDTVPTRGGKPVVIYRSTYEAPQEYHKAREAMAAADAEYNAHRDWITHKQRHGKGTEGYQKALADLEQRANEKHKIVLERNKEILAEGRKAEAEHRAQEKKDLTPRHLEGAALERAEEIATKHFTDYVKNGEKSVGWANNPLRLKDYDTPEKQAPLIDAVTKIQAINPNIPTRKIAMLVTTAVTHVGTDAKAKENTLNDHVGEKGSRFLVVGEDLARNPVIALGQGTSRVVLHVPRDTLNEIKRLKNASYTAAKDKLQVEADTPKTNYSALIPPPSASGKKIADTIGGGVSAAVDKVKEGAAAVKAKTLRGLERARQEYEKGPN